MFDKAYLFLTQEILDGKEIGIPPSVLEGSQDEVVLLCNLDQFFRLSRGFGERFLHKDYIRINSRELRIREIVGCNFTENDIPCFPASKHSLAYW